MAFELTNFLKHFIALIEDEDLEIWEVKVTFLDKCQNSSWCTNNYMRLLKTFQESDMFIDWHSTINDLSPDIWKLSRESGKLFLDLISELSIVTQDKCRAWFRCVWKLMEDCKHKDSSLPHSWLCLTQDVNTDHCLGNALLLYFWGVLKTTINNGTLKLWLQEQIFETSCIHWDVLEPKFILTFRCRSSSNLKSPWRHI